MNHSLGKLHFVSLLHFELPVEKKNKDVRNQSVRVFVEGETKRSSPDLFCVCFASSLGSIFGLNQTRVIVSLFSLEIADVSLRI